MHIEYICFDSFCSDRGCWSRRTFFFPIQHCYFYQHIQKSSDVLLLRALAPNSLTNDNCWMEPDTSSKVQTPESGGYPNGFLYAISSKIIAVDSIYEMVASPLFCTVILSKRKLFWSCIFGIKLYWLRLYFDLILIGTVQHSDRRGKKYKAMC